MVYRSFIAASLLAGALTAESADLRLVNAAQQQSLETVSRLIGQKVSINDAQGDGMTALHWAAYHDDVALLRTLLKAGADTGAKTRNGLFAPLHLAARNGSVQIIQELLQAGAAVDQQTDTGSTPLMLAASSGSLEAVQLLVKNGAQVNVKDTAKEQTALMYASALDRTSVVSFLLANGADPKVKSKVTRLERLRMDLDGNVFPASGGGAAGAAKPESSKPANAPKEGSGVTATDKTTQSDPPKEVAKEASTQPVEESAVASASRPAEASKPAESTKPAAGGVQKAGDVAARPPRESGATLMGGNTALLFAARDGHLKTVEALLDGGADINQTGDSDKTSPLVISIINGHYDVAAYLLKRGADVNLVNDAGLGALYATVDVQWSPKSWYPQPDTTQQHVTYLQLLKELLDRKADPNVKLTKRLWFRGLAQDPVWVDAKGSTPFWRAAQSADTAAMKLLTEHGADPKIPSDQGVTPLMVASGLGWMANHSTNAPDAWLDAAKLAIELGDSNVQAADTRGYTPLHGAAYIGHNELVKFLISKGAKVDAKTKAGDSPADMANGPTRFGLPQPETFALLVSLGSPSSDNCRSDQCLVAPQKDPRARPQEKPAEKPAEKATGKAEGTKTASTTK